MSCFTAPASYKNKLSLWDDSLHSVWFWRRARTHARRQHSLFPCDLPRPALKHGQAKAHFSRGDALSSRGVHMKEQQNIKECPRIHCSAQCEDNLALMENLDQRPGLHNCTFPNKLSATEWARPLDSWDPTQAAPQSFHLAMFSISVSRAKRLEKSFHSRSARDFPFECQDTGPRPRPPVRPSPFVFPAARGRRVTATAAVKNVKSHRLRRHISPERNLCPQRRANRHKNASVFSIA